MLKVSIIIPTFNRCKSVKHLLTSFLKQTFNPKDFEVIVSIDGSQDGTQEMVEEFNAPYRLTTVFGQNSGKASACNRGIEKARGSVLIIIDDDMEPCPDFVNAHYSIHEKNAKAAVIGSAPIIFTDKSSPVLRYIGTKFNDHIKKLSKPGYKVRIWDFYDGNFSIRRDLLIEMGLYDNSFKLYGHEEVELAYRFINEGIPIIFSNEAMCVQHYEKDFKGLTRDRIAEGETAVQLVHLHPKTFSELKLREYNMVGWKWRTLRLSLIHISALFRPIQDLIVMTINIIEKVRPNHMSYLYYLTLDYFFWFGVWSALKKDSRNQELKSKIKSYQHI